MSTRPSRQTTASNAMPRAGPAFLGAAVAPSAAAKTNHKRVASGQLSHMRKKAKTKTVQTSAGTAATTPVGADASQQPLLPPPNLSRGPESLSPSVTSVGIRTQRTASLLRTPHPSSSASQRARSSSPPAGRLPQTEGSSPQSCLTLTSTYSSRSIHSPGDLQVTALLSATSRMMERYLLRERPFPTEAEFLLVSYATPLIAKID